MMNKKGQLGQMASVLLIAGVVLVIFICLGYVIKYYLLPVKTVTTQIDSAGDIIDKTYNAENAIYNYEWFKTQYEKIQANRNQVQLTINQIATFKEVYGNNASQWDSATKEEFNRLNTIKLGLQNQDENLVAEYNAKSKMANRAIFKDKLPLNVDKMLW